MPVAPTPVVVALAATGECAARLRGATTEITPAAARYLARTGSYSIDKARSVLGYRPPTDLDEGMRLSERWLKAQGVVG